MILDCISLLKSSYINYKYAFSFVNSINKNGSGPCYYTGVVKSGLTDTSRITQRECLLDKYKMQSMVITVYVPQSDVHIFINGMLIAERSKELPHAARGGVIAGRYSTVEISEYNVFNTLIEGEIGGMQNWNAPASFKKP